MSRVGMKKIKMLRRCVATVAIFGFLFLTACGDDDRDFATRPSGDSSSSVTPKSSCSSNIPDQVGESVETADGSLTDSRDGQTYKTVKIGDQTWMAENLNYEITNSYCYEDNAANCAKYGRLYTWAAAMDSAGTWSANGKGCGYGSTCSVASTGSVTLVRGVCPEGWRLPSQTEWNTLFTAVGGSSVAGTKLKSFSGWNSSGNGMDDFLFSALPAGGRYYDGDFFNEGSYAFFWSSTENSSDYAYSMNLNYGLDDAYLYLNIKYYGFSVRCLKD